MTALARAHCIALQGLSGVPVEIQTHVGPGIVGTTLVGLPDASLREAKERVRAAFSSLGIPAANKRVTVNLTPADLPKAGSGFDLAIAVSMLAARSILPDRVSEGTVLMAELALDGSLLPVSGVLPAAAAAKQAGFDRIVVAAGNAREAGLLEDMEVVPARHLRDIIEAFTHTVRRPWSCVASDAGEPELVADVVESASPDMDLSDVRGQDEAVAALAVAAAGGHHMLMHGPPGAGKTMLARRLPGLLPDLSTEDALASTALRSLHGAQNLTRLVRRPPLQAPHHSATMVSLIGGGNPIRPGAVSLAHGGVLLLDEAPEFAQRTLDALRQPIEQSEVVVHRAKSQVTFPARFQLVMTANPCPCGGTGASGDDDCSCTPHRISSYRARLSGPLLDRVDLRVHVSRPSTAALLEPGRETTCDVAQKVLEARERSARRWCETSWRTNSEIPGRQLAAGTDLDHGAGRDLESLVQRGFVSLRGADRVMRMAWSCADLEGREVPSSDDFAKAMRLRGIGQAGPSW